MAATSMKREPEGQNEGGRVVTNAATEDGGALRRVRCGSADGVHSSSSRVRFALARPAVGGYHRAMRKWLLPGILGLLVAAFWGAWFWRTPLTSWLRATFPKVISARVSEPRPDPEKYRSLKRDLEARRLYLGAQYRSATTPAARAAIEAQARQSLETTLPEMMRCWLGTPWDFNGTAEAPGSGKIACGYFVSTVLKDAGFKVNRYNLARQASGNILRSFLPMNACTRLVGKPYAEFTATLAASKPGIYVVGLDSHVAFIVLGKAGFRFIHSSGAKPWCVVEESSAEAGVLQRSNWRMFGNLTAHPEVLKRWLNGSKINVKGNE